MWNGGLCCATKAVAASKMYISSGDGKENTRKSTERVPLWKEIKITKFSTTDTQVQVQ